MASKPLVLVVGGTGNTGKHITEALLNGRDFRVAVLTRPSSLSKPALESFRAKGAEIRTGDFRSDSVEKLKEALSGVDILISSINGFAILDQKPLLAAAKEVGVKRVIPCDFATPGKRGVRELNDTKLEIHDYIKQLGLGYTFIDIGWWTQLTLPSPLLSSLSYKIIGKGDKKLLVTDVTHVGPYVARIIADERTLNHSVIVWEDEVTLLDVKRLVEKYSPDGEAAKDKWTYLTYEELLKLAAQGREEYKRTGNPEAHVLQASSEYMISIHILGEDSLENAKALGYLDVRELYPDIHPTSLEEFAQEFYSQKKPAFVYSTE
ncbi:NAD(P)-binding protein [Laetiporus sulphureus 93-53]|uniref:NAD(P)-binding protein n=1 Tax=Laetiporus sulphureus 93-53 TaxID=1314785 RepID=A0A165CWQ2_9APHY|nr:NAD(P)-binding protein [Laetiporus sulphureus 93-53]KZT03606.1 NAD(P)-binding protein [Laetiporus sulphureus 93-53]